MEFQDLRDEIIENIPELEQQFWSYHTSAKQELDGVVWTYIHPNIRKSDPLAFACRSRNTTGVFEIYVNPNIPSECQEPLELHEFGHVIFTHMSLMENQRKIIIQKIMSYWNRFEKHIDENALKTKEDIQKASKIICNAILNIAMDYEVNSKLYTDEEWVIFKEYVQWACANARALAPNSTEEQLKEALEWVKNPTESSLFTPCWPEDDGFPKGLDYRQYVDLILMKPENAMDIIKSKIKGNKNAGQSMGGDEESDQNSTPDKISKDDLDRILQEQNDANNEENNQVISDAEAQDCEENGTNKRQEINTPRWSPFSHVKSDDVISIKNHKRLKRKLLNEIINKHILLSREDTLYYYNRKKYNSDTMISKTKGEDVYRPGNIYLLVDCSCSIGSEIISVIVGTVKEIAKSCGPYSRIIWWDTDLAGDYPLKSFKGPSTYGGTTIWKGIEYVRQKYLKRSNDKLIILSDYYDSLVHWYDELCKIKNDCVGICWGNFEGTKVDVKFMKDRSTTYDGRDIYADLMKKLPTTLVNVGKREDYY